MCKNNSVIQLENIDTSTAEENFSKLLDENKTYFLNGAWGSGKTTFLEKVSEKKNKKLIFIDLWKINDSRPTLEIVFSKLHPIYYYGILALSILSVAVSILSTNVVNLGIENLIKEIGLPFKFLFFIVGIIALLVAIYQFFKFKSDIFWIFLFNKLPHDKVVLIFDDFDRLTEKQQEETYKIFSLLKGKLPIVFVGDISNIYEVKTNFLSKIIDRRIELPFALHPNNIWETYFGALEEKFETILSQDFKQLIINEGRNLRDREHFNDYVSKEFFDRGKLGHVQIEQQLLVIYTYLFHSNLYQNLINGFGVDIDEGDVPKFLITSQIDGLYKYNEGYPPCFAYNRSEYFLYEQVSNTAVSELEEIINSDVLLKEQLLSSSGTDFYKYLSANYGNFTRERKEKLLQLALEYIRDYKTSDTISYIIREKQNEIMPPKTYIGTHGNSLMYSLPKERKNKTDEEINNEIYDGWKIILDKANYDFSQQLYLLVKYHIFSFHVLGERFTDVQCDTILHSSDERKDIMLLVYLSSSNLWTKFSEWTDDIWEVVYSLTDTQFISFWILQGIISNGRNRDDFDYIPSDKTLTVWEKTYSFDYGNEIDNSQTVSMLKHRLDKMELEGFKIKYEIDGRYKIEE
ncbi:P-loop NTPase fold protein [Streptococcus hillyeri]|uniref:KAP NTPase domain-containing protein n=1 Tax=Streptococcus hillyeri TaxID=2282420 RepID=A0A3L9DX72_9STRE|nr:P-loop NTPase fold protein [Streptococcus hillyeri]RLY04878.1 hypothetical protein EAF07_02530 [Streptococcus hillyeri]